jgi:hypothetical protein
MRKKQTKAQRRLKQREIRERRLCPHCRSYPHPAGPDACLGVLRGVQWACCGHGATDDTAYVIFTPERLQVDAALRQYLRAVDRAARGAQQSRAGTVRLPGMPRPVPEGCYGQAALAYFRSQGVGPDHPPEQLWLPLSLPAILEPLPRLPGS